jgi:hypothetical protein
MILPVARYASASRICKASASTATRLHLSRCWESSPACQAARARRREGVSDNCYRVNASAPMKPRFDRIPGLVPFGRVGDNLGDDAALDVGVGRAEQLFGMHALAPPRSILGPCFCLALLGRT